MSTLTLRPFRDADWPQLWPIVRETLQEQETYAVDPELPEAQARQWWLTGRVTVALDEAGRLRGSAHAYPNREGPGGHVASASFMVAGDSRGEGVGRRLVEDVIAWARSEGYTAIQFNAVVEGNTAAEKLYADLGFTVVGTVPAAFRSPTRGDVGLHVMHLPLHTPTAPTPSAPTPATVAPPQHSPGMAELAARLDRLHDALLWKLEGLSERDQRRPLTPTGTNLLGLLKHCACTEAGYLGDVVGRPWPEGYPWDVEGVDPDDNLDMFATEDESAADVVALAERVWAHTRVTLETLDLDAPGEVPWWPEERRQVTLGEVLVHVIVDIARHVGHADILREQLDGQAGLGRLHDNLPDHDERWWAEHVARLQAIADSRA